MFPPIGFEAQLLEEEVRVLAAELEFVEVVLAEIGTEGVIGIDLEGELLSETFRGVIDVEDVLRIIGRVLQLAEGDGAGPARRLEEVPTGKGPIDADGFAATVILESLVG